MLEMVCIYLRNKMETLAILLHYILFSKETVITTDPPESLVHWNFIYNPFNLKGI